MSKEKFNDVLKQRYEFTYKIAQIWEKHGFVAMISPMWPHVAFQSQNHAEMGLFVEYSNMWNLTGFPAGVMPVCNVQEKETEFKDGHNDSWTKVLNEDAKGTEGLPVTI